MKPSGTIALRALVIGIAITTAHQLLTSSAPHSVALSQGAVVALQAEKAMAPIETLAANSAAIQPATAATTIPDAFEQLSEIDQQWYRGLKLDQQEVPFANKLQIIQFARSREQALYDGMEAAQLVPAATPLGSDCTTKGRVDAATGERRSYEDCVPYYDESAHPYFSYTTDSLLALSESDAVANYVLGGRAADLDLKFTYMMRASALSGKPGPISDVFNQVAGPVDKQGRARKEEVSKRYVLKRLGYSMGFTNMDPSGMAAELSARFTAEELANLDRRVQNLQVEMNRLRLDRGMRPLPFNQETK